ncbi:MAG: hypothetical protein PHV82_16530 [Victivallaceae bacterium]|nr:hypothetical protein [Victivallaceae bacterium]
MKFDTFNTKYETKAAFLAGLGNRLKNQKTGLIIGHKAGDKYCIKSRYINSPDNLPNNLLFVIPAQPSDIVLIGKNSDNQDRKG